MQALRACRRRGCRCSLIYAEEEKARTSAVSHMQPKDAGTATETTTSKQDIPRALLIEPVVESSFPMRPAVVALFALPVRRHVALSLLPRRMLVAAEILLPMQPVAAESVPMRPVVAAEFLLPIGLVVFESLPMRLLVAVFLPMPCLPMRHLLAACADTDL